MYKKIFARLENHLHLDLTYFINNGSLTVTVQVIDAIFALVLASFLSHFTDKNTFGNYYLIISLLSLASITSIPGITAALTRAVALGYEGDYQKIFVSSLHYSLLGSLLLLAASFFFGITNQTEMFVSLLLCSLFFPFLYSFNNCWSGLLIGKKLFRQGLFYSLVCSTTLLASTGLTAILSAKTIFIVMAFLLGTAIPNALIFFLAAKTIKNSHKNQDTQKYALFITKTGIIAQISLYIDQLSMGFFLNPTAVANYRVASSLTNVLRNLEKSATNILAPKILAYPENEIKHRIVNLLPLLIALQILGLIIFGLLQPHFILIFFSNKYADIVLPAQIILASLFLTPVELVPNQFFIATKKTIPILVINTVIPLVKIFATVGSFAFFGFNGVILSNLVTRIFNALLYRYLLTKK